MKKNELYKTLKADGEDLPPFNLCKKEDLEARYAQLHGETAESESESEADEAEEVEEQKAPERTSFPLLFFTSAGWCSELNRSYFIGMYRPRTEAEYNALRKYAEREV